jgi:hypothetical protein
VDIGLLEPDAIYEVVVNDSEGRLLGSGHFDADGLPDAMRLANGVMGAPSVPYTVFPFGCDGAASHVVIVDAAGTVVGFEDVAAAVGFSGVRAVRGLTDSGEGTLLVLVGNDSVVEYDPDVGIVATWTATDGTLPAVVHHDVARHDGLLWVLTAEEVEASGRRYVMDGVVALDAAGNVAARWNVGDVLLPDGSGQPSGYWADAFPGAVDFVHANSIAFDAEGGLLVSLHKEDAVLRLDPGLALDWLLVGNNGSALAPGDVVLSGSGGVVPTFRGQHHVTSPEPGALWMLDNEGVNEGARALVFSLTEGAATAVDERQTGLVCPGQGSATRLDNGSAVIGCSAEAAVVELPASGPPAFRLDAACAYGSATDDTVYRALPFTPR